MIWFTNYTGIEQLVIAATIIFLTVLIAEIFDCAKLFSAVDIAQYNYGYDTHNGVTYIIASSMLAIMFSICTLCLSNEKVGTIDMRTFSGPSLWKCFFPKSKGKMQSPINISTRSVMCVPSETLKPLKFSTEYYSMPSSVVAINDGHGLIVYACWNDDALPKLSGGPLTGSYRFDSARLRWGPNDEEGSEHTVDSVRYAMEIQAMHTKADKTYYDIAEAAEDKAALCVTYLFQITPMDNPYLEPLLAALKNIQMPCTHCLIDPFPLCWLILPFTSKYFTYMGSLTYPPCTECVEWLVQSETLSISSRQVKKFRKLMSCDGPMETNTRPVQEVNSRDIYFYD